MKQSTYQECLRQYERFMRTPPRNENEERTAADLKKQVDINSIKLQKWLELVRAPCCYFFGNNEFYKDKMLFKLVLFLADDSLPVGNR